MSRRAVAIGDEIEKEFEGHGIFRGTVVEITTESGSKKKLYTIRYDDGDNEDLYIDELKPLLVNKKRSTPKKLSSPPKKRAVHAKPEKPGAYDASQFPTEQFYVMIRRVSGEDVTIDERGVFDDQERAIAGARRARSIETAFTGWAIKKYGQTPPPWNSREGPGRGDSQEYTEILIESTVDRASAGCVEEVPAGPMGHDVEAEIVVDNEVFERHPAAAVLGGRPCPVNNFPDGYVHFMKRLSDMCYSVAAFSEDQSRGARYQTQQYTTARAKSIVWLPPAKCGLGGSLVASRESIVDTLHTDLVDDKTGCILVRTENLIAACSKATKILFVNSFDDDAGLAQAIGRCGDLESVVCVECRIGKNTLSALQDKAQHLKGLHFHLCTLTPELDKESVGDIAFAAVLKAAENLKWFGADLTCLQETAGLGPLAWAAIPASCQVIVFEGSWKAEGIYVQGFSNGKERFLKEYGEQILEKCKICPKLHLVLIQRDPEGISCINK